MRLRWLLLAVVTMSLLPSIASARSQIHLYEQPAATDYTIGAAVDGGEHFGNLVIAFYNPDPIHSIEVPVRVVAKTIQYDWLTVEISNATIRRTLRFIEPRDRSAVQTARIQPRGLHFETIDLDPQTRDLPAGDYDVVVRWDGQVTTTKLSTTFVPLRCGLAYHDWPSKQEPSKLPFVLGGLAIVSFVFLGLALAKRAGTAVERVPCSPL
jgi:hypothetical protein